jgi:hypothetical protein
MILLSHKPIRPLGRFRRTVVDGAGAGGPAEDASGQGLISMLVKVRNDDPSRLSSTERTVVAWLQTWRDARALAGIAVFKAHGTDLIVFTPEACVVVAIKSFTERATGTLRCGADEPWTLDGRIAPLEGVQTGNEPIEEILARTDEITRLLRSAPGRERLNITGVVLVVPQFGSRITLDRGHLPDGIDVVRGDGPSSLRSYVMRAAADNPGSWDAAQVGQALGVLGFAAAATFAELTDEGFPAPAADRTPPQPAYAAQSAGGAAQSAAPGGQPGYGPGPIAPVAAGAALSAGGPAGPQGAGSGGQPPQYGPGGQPPQYGPGGQPPQFGPGGQPPQYGPAGQPPQFAGQPPQFGPGGQQSQSGPGGPAPQPGPLGSAPQSGLAGVTSQPGPAGSQPLSGPAGSQPGSPAGSQPLSGPAGPPPGGPGGSQPQYPTGPAPATAAMGHGAPVPPPGRGPAPAQTPPYGTGPAGAPIPAAGAPTPPPPQYGGPAAESVPPSRDPNAPYAAESQPYSIPFDPRPAARPRRRLGSVVPLVVLVFLVLILGLVAMCSGGSDHKSTGGTTGGGHSQVATTVRPTGVPPAPSTPTELTVPSPTAGRACFPLQPNC